MIETMWMVWSDTGREDCLHPLNPYTGRPWTRDEALLQQRCAEDGNVLAVLVVDAEDVAYFVEDGQLMVCPLYIDGRPAIEDAVALDLDHASSGGLEVEWLAEQFGM